MNANEPDLYIYILYFHKILKKKKPMFNIDETTPLILEVYFISAIGLLSFKRVQLIPLSLKK